ncbi:MAG: hypothetical protein H6658_19550 [Ardenticatenaceae bacterium]|nr:hypothetical protein [Ardenticatenaceae bacterium]
MTTQILLMLPDELYEEAAHAAEVQNMHLDNLLVNLIRTGLPGAENKPSLMTYEPDRDVEKEINAYHQLHPTLKKNYLGQHVAILDGELIDHDADGVALSQRVYEKFPDKFILIREVETESDRILHFRSPRLLRN